MARRALGAGVLVMTMAAMVTGQYALRRGKVILPDKTVIHVEIADTDETRQRGLMHRESMADNAGMVFVFPEPALHPFWMKNTLIPLDMIWLDEKYRIVAILEAEPCRADPCPNYDPRAEAAYVVELNRGLAKRHGLAVGATLVFRDIPEPGKVR
jgi:uncharacterized membrane protein (UPF0127 family)